MANRVPEPRRIRIFGKRPPVGPDGSPFVFALEELDQRVRGIDELHWCGHEHDARKPDRIALQNRVVPAGAGSGSVPGDFLVELRLRPGSHWRHILFFNEAFCSALALILPDSGKVTFGSWRRGRV